MLMLAGAGTNLLPREDHGASVLQDCGLSRGWRSELGTSAPAVMAPHPARRVQSKGVATAAHRPLKDVKTWVVGLAWGGPSMPGPCRASERPG